MNNEMIELIVEEIMKCQSFNNYEDYIDEKVRGYYRKMLREEQNASSEKLC